jgi:hypothetical protein
LNAIRLNERLPTAAVFVVLGIERVKKKIIAIKHIYNILLEIPDLMTEHSDPRIFIPAQKGALHE